MRVLIALWLVIAGVSSSPSPRFSRGRVDVCAGVRCYETAPDCFKPMPSRHHKVPDDIIYCDNAETLCRYPVRKLIGSGEFGEVLLYRDVRGESREPFPSRCERAFEMARVEKEFN